MSSKSTMLSGYMIDNLLKTVAGLNSVLHLSQAKQVTHRFGLQSLMAVASTLAVICTSGVMGCVLAANLMECFIDCDSYTDSELVIRKSIIICSLPIN